MATKNLGFGGSAASNYATLNQVISESARTRFSNVINNDCPLFASGALEEIDADGEEIVHTVFPGALHSGQWVRDFGPLSKAAANKPHKLRATPKNVFVRTALGRAALKVKLSDERLASIADAHMDQAANDAKRILVRGICGATASPQATAAWTGTGDGETVTLPFEDVSMFRPGAAYDYIDTSTSKSYVVRCVSVTPGSPGSNSENVAGTVVFSNDIIDPATDAVIAIDDNGAVTVATTDVFRLRGETAGFGGASTVTGDAITSFSSAAAASGEVNGLSASTEPMWIGTTRSVGGIYSQEYMAAFMMFVQQFSGEFPTHVIMSPALGAAHAISAGYHGAVAGQSGGLQAYATRSLDQSMDKFGALKEGYDSGLRCGGKPVILEPNWQATKVTLHNKKFAKLCVWDKMGPEEEAGDPILLDRDTFSAEVQYSGQYEMLFTKRPAIAEATGFTGL